MSQTLNAAPAKAHGMGRALVVGGSCAIGQAIARSLASDGRQVTVTYHSSKAATTAFVQEHKLMEAAQLDISADRAALESYVLRDKAEHGGKVPNVVVFCAAGIEPVALGDMDATVFQKHFDTVVRGPLFMIQVRANDVGATRWLRADMHLYCRRCTLTWSQIRGSYSSLRPWQGPAPSLTIAMRCTPLRKPRASN